MTCQAFRGCPMTVFMNVTLSGELASNYRPWRAVRCAAVAKTESPVARKQAIARPRETTYHEDGTPAQEEDE